MSCPEYQLKGIASALEHFEPQHITEMSGHRKAAAVAMILREQAGVIEMLFIERAADERDPWSGHLAFPGGKIEDGETPCQAAVRETYEEIGVMLSETSYIGRLSDIIGTNLPVQVACHVFILTADIIPAINEEVCDIFWVPLHEIYNSQRHTTTTVHFAESSLEVPSILMPQPGKPVLWGITYRLVMQLYEILQVEQNPGCNPENKRYTHDIEYL